MSSLDQVIDAYYEQQAQLKELSAQSKEVRKQIKSLSSTIIELMLEANIDHYENSQGMTISLKTEIDKKKK